tara:strand:- start:333 stop:545 length:213 start_codon:yes stop_codon:yes gene_type:complete
MKEYVFKVGDLVTLKDYCKNSGRMAMVTRILPEYLARIDIIYLDESKEESRKMGRALTINVIPWEERDND